MVEESGRIQKENSGHGRYVAYTLIVVILIAQSVLLIMLPRPAIRGTSNQVTLTGVPWNKTVPMFETLDEVEAPLLKQFADGTTCTKLSGPTEAGIKGTRMNFYLLECDGTTGYVHARQVQE